MKLTDDQQITLVCLREAGAWIDMLQTPPVLYVGRACRGHVHRETVAALLRKGVARHVEMRPGVLYMDGHSAVVACEVQP